MDFRKLRSLWFSLFLAWVGLASAMAAPERAAADGPIVTIKGTGKSFSYKGAAGSLSFTVSSPSTPNAPVIFTPTADDPSWVVIDPGYEELHLTLNAKGYAKGTVKYHVLPCAVSLAQSRTAKIQVEEGKEFLVSQAGAPCVLTIALTKGSALAVGGEGEIGVTAPLGCAWTAARDPVKYPWLSIVDGASGEGPGTVEYSVDANWTGKSRSGKVLLASAAAKPSRKTHTVTQDKNLAVAPPTFSPGAGAYVSAQNVVLATATLAAKIRYTTDGTTPTPTVGTEVVSGAAVPVAVTTTLKAIAYRSGLLASTVSSAEYTVGAEPEVLTARAGADQRVVQDDVVVLDGSMSSGPDGIASYAWAQTGGQGVELSDAASSTPTFSAPEVGAGGEDLTFELTVSDGLGATTSDTLVVHVSQTEQPPPPTSVQLIDEAVASGAVTAEKGLTYKVLAVFGDDRLPAQYKGSEPDLVGGTGIMAEVAEKYDGLSAEAKAEVYPFLLPAYVTNSWYDLASRQGLRVGRAGRAGRVSRIAAAPAPVWMFKTNGKAKIWYDSTLVINQPDGTTTTFEEIAEGVFDAVGGTIWDKLQDLMKVEPLPDGGLAWPALPSPDYGALPSPAHADASNALDIILAHGMNASGYTHPYHAAPTPAFITIDALMWPLGDEKTPGLIQIVAHELMHAWQFRYPKKADPLSYYWVMEATAAWTEDYVYPDANSENRYAAWYLDTTRLPADDQTNFRQYGLYTAVSFWTNGDGAGSAKAPPSMVKKIWENAGTMTSIEAVDQAHPLPSELPIELLPRWTTSFFERFWMDSLVAAWNRGMDGYFFQKDKLADGAKVGPNKATLVTLGGQPDKVYFLEDLDGAGKIEIPYLSGRYYHFVFSEDSARTVLFYDGLRTKLELLEADRETLVYGGEPVVPIAEGGTLVDPIEGAEWRMLTKIDGQWTEWLPPYHMPGASLYYGMPGWVSFCRDAKAERIQELVVILGNSAPNKSVVVTPPEYSPLLLVSNMGCWGWDGTITADDNPTGGYRTQTTATVKWRRAQDVYPAGAPPGTVPPGPFLLENGLFHTEISGQVDDCSYSGSDSWSDSSLGDAQATLGLMPEARSGGFYRTFEGDGSSGEHEVSYHYQCKDISGNSTTKPIWWRPNPGEGLAEVSSDGTTIQGGSDSGDTHYEWTLRAVREP